MDGTVGEREHKKRDEDATDNEEELEWIVDNELTEEAKVSVMIIGKLWTTRNVNSKALMDTLSKIWNLKHGIEARKIEENLYSF